MPLSVDLSGVLKKAETALKEIQDLNSSFPATKDFLRARGLKNVSELDEAGTKDLFNHLLDVYAGLRREKETPERSE